MGASFSEIPTIEEGPVSRFVINRGLAAVVSHTCELIEQVQWWADIPRFLLELELHACF